MLREYTNKQDTLAITYEVRDESFSHAFGVEKKTSYEITKIEAYIPALGTHVDVTNHSDFSDVAQRLLEQAIADGE